MEQGLEEKKINVWFYISTKRSCVANKSSILPCYISIFNLNKFDFSLIFYCTENQLCVLFKHIFFLLYFLNFKIVFFGLFLISLFNIKSYINFKKLIAFWF